MPGQGRELAGTAPPATPIDLESMLHILARQRDDLSAAVRQLDQQPVRRQHAEGLAQRRPGHAQPLAQLALVQPCARCQLTLDDQGAQPLGRRFGQARTRDRESRAIHNAGLALAYCIQNAIPNAKGLHSMRLNSHPSGRHFLQIPGPDQRSRTASCARWTMPTIDHRGPEFARWPRRCCEGCKQVFQTTQPVIDLSRVRAPAPGKRRSSTRCRPATWC